MYDPRIYANGIQGVFSVRWKLRCETPLALRNGLRRKYREGGQSKERGQNLRMNWKQPQGDHEVTDLHYGYKITDGRVGAIHFVPGSSVRGALRGWAIRYLVSADATKGLTLPNPDKEQELETYLETLYNALDAGERSYDLLFSLFGQVADIESEKKLEANAGRLLVDVEPFAGTEQRGIDSGGMVMPVTEGPTNARRHMMVRSPIDRITHATKDGGLHHFLEFSRGETFVGKLTIVNPQPQDLGLLALWRREINNGLLRFGALATIGRGRMSIQEETYALWQQKNATLFNDLSAFVSQEVAMDVDPLAGIWQNYQLPAEELSSFTSALTTFLEG